MSEPQRDQREQEISIKQREGEMFRREAESSAAARPFSDYLRETPAHPLPAWVKAVLWAVGFVVVLLLAAALWRLQSKPPPRPRASRKGSPSVSSHLERPPSALFSLPAAGRSTLSKLEKS